MTSERETPNTDALLPCPFCGSSQLREGIHCFGHGDYSKTVECDCGARMADYYGDSYAKWNTRTPAPSVTSEEWRPATTDTNPLVDGDYLTIYRRSEWADGHYVHKVCRFALGNNCTGHIWDATVGEQLWNVKFWMPLPYHPLTAFHVTKKE